MGVHEVIALHEMLQNSNTFLKIDEPERLHLTESYPFIMRCKVPKAKPGLNVSKVQEFCWFSHPIEVVSLVLDSENTLLLYDLHVPLLGSPLCAQSCGAIMCTLLL